MRSKYRWWDADQYNEGKISYQFPNFIVVIWEWIINFFPHMMGVMKYG